MWKILLAIFVLYDMLWLRNDAHSHDGYRGMILLVAALQGTDDDTAANDLKAASECNLYLVQSTIPGAGLGVFAGSQDYNPGDDVSYSDIVIPIEDIIYHNGGMFKPYEFLWDEYTWVARNFPGMEQETEGSDMLELEVNAASPGFGAAVNSMLNLFNVDDDNQRTFSLDTAGLYYIGKNNNESKPSSVPQGVSSRPGAGAFTPYHGRVFHATKYIPAGMELFVNYGANYFMNRPQYKSMPMSKDYKLADKLVKKFL